MSDATQAKRLLDEITQERKKGSQIRLATTGLVFLMFAGFASSVYGQIQNFDTDTLLQGLKFQK